MAETCTPSLPCLWELCPSLFCTCPLMVLETCLPSSPFILKSLHVLPNTVYLTSRLSRAAQHRARSSCAPSRLEMPAAWARQRQSPLRALQKLLHLASSEKWKILKPPFSFKTHYPSLGSESISMLRRRAFLLQKYYPQL